MKAPISQLFYNITAAADDDERDVHKITTELSIFMIIISYFELPRQLPKWVAHFLFYCSLHSTVLCDTVSGWHLPLS